ncbi:MAG: precorrin-6A reductase [Lachnospiraceae bacterium]
MQQVIIISFTRAGSRLNQRIYQTLSKREYKCESFSTPSYANEETISSIPKDRTTWFAEHWGKTAYIFIGAAGIAIRYIMPFLKDKYTDSAVLVLDEKGQFVIPLIAGHVGGAVSLAKLLAKEIGAVPVITTATDVNETFAVDVFAKEYQLIITDRYLAKAISAAVLNGKQIGFYSEREVPDPLPKEVVQVNHIEELEQYSYGIAVLSGRQYHMWMKKIPKNTLCLQQKANIIVGIGCKKGVSMEDIDQQLSVLLETHHLTIWDVKLIASIDVKKEEPGIKMLAEAYDIPYQTYSAEELNQVKQVSSRSPFVQAIVGVDNVCERAAQWGACYGTLIQPKVCMKEVTFSLVKERREKSIILVFAGTTEGRELIEYLQRYEVTVIACVATEYGKYCLTQSIYGENGNTEIREGRLSEEEMVTLIQSEHVELVVDATHPFAEVVTHHIQNACHTTQVEYVRLLRSKEQEKKGQMIYVDTVKDAVHYLQHTKGNILISTGSKELGIYTQIPDYQERCYARVLSTKQSVEDSVRLGFQGTHLIAMQGPFSKHMNAATLEQTKARYFVTKDSGVTGGFGEKAEAASELGVQLVVIGRPKEEGNSMEEIQAMMKGRYKC